MLPAANLARASLSGVYRLFARRDSVRSIRRQGRLAGVGVKPVCGLHRAQIGEDPAGAEGSESENANEGRGIHATYTSWFMLPRNVAPRVSFRPGSLGRAQRRNAHGTEERELLYPWRPWAGRSVCVHEVTEKAGWAAFRCRLGSHPIVSWKFRSGCSIGLPTKGGGGAGCLDGVPGSGAHWEMLPEEAQVMLTGLMGRLILDHTGAQASYRTEARHDA